MASNKPVKPIKESLFKIGGIDFKYAILKDDTYLISQSSLFEYLQLDEETQNNITFPNSKDIIPYQSIDNTIEIGLPVKVFILTTIILLKESNKGLYERIEILLKEFSIIGLNKVLIDNKDNRIESEIEDKGIKFDDLLGGLLRVPPPKKEKK